MRNYHSAFVALIIVILAALAAASLFVVALVEWLTVWFGSVVTPCMIVGGVFALLAFIIYRVSLRDALHELSSIFGATYDMIKLLRLGAEWVLTLLRKESL